MTKIVILAHNIRSTHNVGAIFRTAEGFGVSHIYFSGYTPYPAISKDSRLPHIAQKITKQIHKTALDAESIVPFSHHEEPPLQQLQADGYEITALEQASTSIMLPDYSPPSQVALLIGEEVDGIDPALLAHCSTIIEIPMYGKKESFNVSVATGIALYHLRHN